MKVNGTVAKDIAIYFFDATNTRYTPSIISKTIVQAKHLLEAGYTKEEIKSTIDWVVNKTNVKMYSLGYINTMINKILENIEEERIEEEFERKKQELKQKFEEATKEHLSKEEVVGDDKSGGRNKNKLDGFGFKSRFGKESDFNMFEEPRKDN